MERKANPARDSDRQQAEDVWHDSLAALVRILARQAARDHHETAQYQRRAER